MEGFDREKDAERREAHLANKQAQVHTTSKSNIENAIRRADQRDDIEAGSIWPGRDRRRANGIWMEDNVD